MEGEELDEFEFDEVGGSLSFFSLPVLFLVPCPGQNPASFCFRGKGQRQRRVTYLCTLATVVFYRPNVRAGWSAREALVSSESPVV